MGIGTSKVTTRYGAQRSQPPQPRKRLMSTPATHPATSAPRAAKRHAPEVRRALIVAAAQEVIVEIGFPGTSARLIAARCGISLGTLTYHFASVDALLIEALRDASVRLTDEITLAVDAVDGAVNKLQRIAEDALPTSLFAKRNWRLWLEYWARAAHSPDLAALHSERYEAWRGLVLRTIIDGVTSGELVVPNPAASAIQFVALQDGLGLQLAIGDSSVSVDSARAILSSAIDQFIAPEL